MDMMAGGFCFLTHLVDSYVEVLRDDLLYCSLQLRIMLGRHVDWIRGKPQIGLVRSSVDFDGLGGPMSSVFRAHEQP